MTPPDPQPASLPSLDSPPAEATDRDRHINLAFEAYRPVRPLAAKIRAENLLWHSLLHAGALADWDEPLHAIQRRVGRDRSIWGMFFDLGEAGGVQAPSWELRVLNTEARSPLGILDSLRETLRPWIELAPGLEEAPPYAILGLRFDTETVARGRLATVDLHERIPGTHRLEIYATGAGVRELVGRDLVLEPKRHIDEVLPAIKHSEFVDFTANKHLLGRVMIPELFACRRLHISKRPACDALCFSGVNIEQLVFTYKRFEFPEPLLAFLVAHQDRLEHLLFDVAIEYRERDGRIVYPRAGYYGSF